jgi:predicted nucleotidyltransferase
VKINSLDISNKLPSDLVAVFEALLRTAQREGIVLYVVGATARDLLMDYAFGMKSPRLSVDIDVAIRVRDWVDYLGFVGALAIANEMSPTGVAYRYRGRTGTIVDILPFGPIAGPDGQVTVRSAQDVIFSVLGFEEAFNASTPVIISRNPDLEILVCSVAGLAMLKLLSWNEAFPGRPKDAEDFIFLVEHYFDAGNDLRLMTEAPELLEGPRVDYELAGARLLGRDIGRIAGPAIRRKVVEILTREAKPRGQLALATNVARRRISYEETVDKVLEMLRAVLAGVREA